MLLRRILLGLFSHRLLAIGRWDLHFLRIRIWNLITLQPWRLRKWVSDRPTPRFLNLGSGPRGIDDDHWINVDGFRDHHVHYLLDLSRPLPFPDCSFDGVFCEHVLEHFSLGDGERLAREIFRTLRPGGCFRIVVPDAEFILRHYFEDPDGLVAWRGEPSQTPMEVVNSYFRQRYEHQFLYDWITLEKLLLRAGFDAAPRTSYGQGIRCQEIVLDDPKYDRESLYVEAQRHPSGLSTADSNDASRTKKYLAV